MRILLFALFATTALAAPPTLQDVRTAHGARRYAEGLELAKALLKTAPPAQVAARDGASFYGGLCAVELRRYPEGVALLRALVGRTPPSRYARAARNWLLQALTRSRDHVGCLRQARAFLARMPDHADRVFWRYLVCESLMGDWQFAEARTALLALRKDHPGTKYASRIREMLALVVDRVEADANGVMAGYAGKYASDRRFREIVAALPRMLAESRATLKRRLGLELPAGPFVLLRFEDKNHTRAPAFAETRTMCVGGKPTPMIRFYTEHVVVDRGAFARRLTHELKHAHFHATLGKRYGQLPKWIREGLALHGAEQTDDRLAHLVSNHQFMGRDALARLDGLRRHRDSNDYAEEGLAFEWLERRRPGSAAQVCALLQQGKSADAAFAAAAGLSADAAIAAAEAHARARVAAALGPGAREYQALRKRELALRGAALKRWLTETGIPAYEAWLTRHERHALVPNVRYRVGRCRMEIGQHARARPWLQQVIDGGSRRTSIVDDALYWLGASQVQTGDQADARATLGVLLRDWGWTTKGRKLVKTKRYTPAGPVK